MTLLLVREGGGISGSIAFLAEVLKRSVFLIKRKALISVKEGPQDLQALKLLQVMFETLVRGSSFSSKQFAFVQFDLNDFQVEFEVLKFVMKRVVKGSVILFDDFSMVPFSQQNAAYRKFFRFLDLEILELPAGQGLVVV